MPPKLTLASVSTLAFRPTPTTARVPALQTLSRRCISASEKPLPKAEKDTKGPNQDQLPHVSEEAAATSKVMGESGPDISQGTPVEEILQRDEEAQKNAPQVLKDQMNKTSSGSVPSGKRSFSTSIRRQLELALAPKPSLENAHKFGVPPMPIPRNDNIDHRYNEVVDQVTKGIMKHGKLAMAQKNMSIILDHLRVAQPPQVNPDKPLLPGAPPPAQLPLNPVAYLTYALDSVAPLIKIRNQKGAAGGGQALQIPQALPLRARRRTALKWILTAAQKRRDANLADRVAAELVAVVEGRSGVWERRAMVHKVGVAARVNVKFSKAKRRAAT